jgi:hypothetical protein
VNANLFASLAIALARLPSFTALLKAIRDGRIKR